MPNTLEWIRVKGRWILSGCDHRHSSTYWGGTNAWGTLRPKINLNELKT